MLSCSSLRTLTTVLGVAGLTAATALTVLWPHATLADDGADPMAELEGDGTKVDDHVVVDGEVKRDAKSKTGWVVELRAQNKGDQPETVALETDLERTVSNPMSRAEPPPTTVWRQKETITIGAGEAVTRRYVVPAALGAQLSASARSQANAAARSAKGLPTMTSSTYFGVSFQKAHA
jgi:hypothetical protein